MDLPAVTVGGAPLDVSACFARMSNGDLIAEGFPADAFIPAHVLARHDIVFDYPRHRFAVDQGVEPRGTRVPVVSYPRPGWPAVTVTIAEEPVSLLLDTGASCCMFSERLVERLATRITSRARGAFGLANMSGGSWEADVETIRVPDLVWGDVHFPSVVAVSRPAGNFERMMSSGTPVPVEGAIAGNVLRHLRVDWRASHQCAWIQPSEPLIPERLVQVPVVLQAAQGRLTVVAAGERAERNVRPGDALLAVDGVSVSAHRFGEAVQLLGGADGQTLSLLIDRGGKRTVCEAPVAAIV